MFQTCRISWQDVTRSDKYSLLSYVVLSCSSALDSTELTSATPHKWQDHISHRALTLSYGVQRSVLRARDVGLWVVEANG